MTLKILQSDLDLERIKVSKREQETFNAQYQLVGLQEELTRAQTQTQVVEEERNALRTSLKEEEVARVAAEGRIALPPAMADDDEFASPKKQRQKPLLRSQSPEKEPPRIVLELEQLRSELEEYKLVKQQAEEQVDFMRLECQYGCCSCRIAERQNTSFMHDLTFEDEVRQFKPQFGGMPTPPESTIFDDPKEAIFAPTHEQQHRPSTPPFDAQDEIEPPARNEVLFSPTSGTFRTMPMDTLAVAEVTSPPAHTDLQTTRIEEVTIPLTSEVEHDGYDTRDEPVVNEVYNRRKSFALVARIKRAASQLSHNDAQALLPQTPEVEHEQFLTDAAYEPEADLPHDNMEEPPSTPHHGNSSTWRISTTTTKVPLADPSTPKPIYSAFGSPNITREEAIQQLRERRGRARSEARTPKKAADAPHTPRRDISAPEVRAKATPASTSRGRLALR